jgi:NTP pyrophosphatase (non-canonical NTP hydrolase)
MQHTVNPTYSNEKGINISLDLAVLRAANVQRAQTAEKFKHCFEWTSAHWLQAMVGEVGELANFLKKRDRGDFKTEKEKEQNQLDIQKELADVQIYLDLLADELGVCIAHATIEKFNEVSKRVDSSVFINKDGMGWSD